MRKLIPEIERWQEAGKASALATVIKRSGSSLRPVGAKMAVTQSGDIAGSVSGGCVEGAVYQEAQTVIENKIPEVLTFDVSDELAWGVGLACGGSIQVFVEALDTASWREIQEPLKQSLEADQLGFIATVITGAIVGRKVILRPDGQYSGDLGSPELNQQVIRLIPDWLETLEPELIIIETRSGPVKVFVDVFQPPARIIIIGAVHIAISLVSLAKTLGYHTTVIDARSVFATPERFPHVDELIVEWPSIALKRLCPNEATYIVCLSHDEKLDNPAIQVALTSQSRYIGVLGSKKTHKKRCDALRSMGISDDELARIHAPVGLDLDSRYPEEIALSILAEIIAVRHGKQIENRKLYTSAKI